MNETQKLIESLVETYKYKPLPLHLSTKVRTKYTETIPDYLNSPFNPLYTSKGTLICNSARRIVIGDYGAFIEFDESDKANTFCIAKGQEYRLEEKYKNVKYHWLTIDDGSDIKIYFQRNTVHYADYRVGYYYVSVFDVYIKP